MPADAGVASRPPTTCCGAPEHELRAATIGQSSSRRTLGLVGQYGLLVVLAAVVLAPIAFALMQALSPPFDYINAGKPLHPVDVDWKDRTWLTGGAFSVVARTAVVALALAWVQLRAAGGTVRHPAPLARAAPDRGRRGRAWWCSPCWSSGIWRLGLRALGRHRVVVAGCVVGVAADPAHRVRRPAARRGSRCCSPR